MRASGSDTACPSLAKVDARECQITLSHKTERVSVYLARECLLSVSGKRVSVSYHFESSIKKDKTVGLEQI